ncbi:MAG: hypothetical protein V3U90_07875 [Dehalococcoidia bacterium]
MPTVLISVAPEASMQGGPPRILVPAGFLPGNVTGGPFQRDLQRQVVKDALLLLAVDMSPGKIVEKQYSGYRSQLTGAQT